MKVFENILNFLNPVYKAKKYQNLFLPNFRTNEALKNNETYISSATEQIDFLIKKCKLKRDSIFLDFGCGQGRMLNGLKYLKLSIKKYVGVDTDLKSINWCKKWLKTYSAESEFICLPAYNHRYNKNAKGLTELPFKKNHFDIIFLNSVFSHMLIKDIDFYLKEFYKVITKNGFVYLTAFIEENVSSIKENPKNYIAPSVGRLHRVRYEKKFFFDLCEKSGFKIDFFLHHGISRTKQSILVLKRDN